MTSTSSTSKAFVQLTSPEEGNWLSLGRALSTVLCEGRRPNQYHDMRTCQWATVLQAYHLNGRPNWKQSDSTKWMDPNVGPWEIVKLFLPDVGGHTVILSVEDMEITAILNLMFWCNHFTVQRPLIKDVRDTRNTKWAHLPKLELSEAEKKDAFETLEKLLQDPVLARDVDAQGALREILALKYTADVHIFKAEVLSHFKEAIQNEMKSLKKESKRNIKHRSWAEAQLRNLRKSQENVEKKQKATMSVARLVINHVLCVISYLVKSTRGTRRSSVATLLMFLFLCCHVSILRLDHKSDRDGELYVTDYFYFLGVLWLGH
ncbi:hypothetical protein OS493_019820 [Desmophyllum pertusum]|uniref:Uncharacterized protein n=1 Tax=Desmophyllum pertusum TaxID=174260 RepID=A0A9X0CR38_9CNID|nr:hypothetical protein OS493_019820 [Desmophyllum pertusum]